MYVCMYVTYVHAYLIFTLQYGRMAHKTVKVYQINNFTHKVLYAMQIPKYLYICKEIQVCSGMYTNVCIYVH